MRSKNPRPNSPSTERELVATGRLLPVFNWSLFLVLTAILYYAAIDYSARLNAYRIDFAMLHTAAKSLIEGRELYAPLPPGDVASLPHDLIAFAQSLHKNLNPPFLAILMAPLGALDFSAAYVIWAGLSLLAAVAGAVLISRAGMMETEGTGGAKAGAAPIPLLWLLAPLLLNLPTWASVKLGQVSLLVFFLLALSWIAAREGRERTAGAVLGLALALKPFVGLFLLLFLMQRRWRLLAWFAGVFLACAFLAFLVFDLDTYLRYLVLLRKVSWFATSGNASFMGFFTRIFGGSENIPWIDLPILAFGLSYGCSVLSLAPLALISIASKTADSRRRLDFGFALCICLMLLISPLGWVYYFSALLIPVVVLFRETAALPFPPKARYRFLACTAWALGTVPTDITLAYEMNDPLVWFTTAGSHFYALLLFAGLLTSLFLRLRKQENPAHTL